MKTIALEKIRLNGMTGSLVDGITRNFLIGIRESNPAIVTMFRDRDVKPYRDFLPWSGEFAGKYLTSAAYTYRINRSDELRKYVCGLIDELITYQAPDGYLGCYTAECRLSGKARSLSEESCTTWDSWAHYHMMYGLLLWYDISGNKSYFSAAERIAELFIHSFYNGKPTLLSIGSTEMNLSVYHVFAILYRRTKNPDYLAFARLVERDLNSPGSGEYMRYALEGYEYYQCPKPRWESMHAIMGFVEMYNATGEERYITAATRIFYSILKTDVHNTGAFSTKEQAVGNPFQKGSIETCCVVAYNALASDLYLVTGDPKIADFLELSHYNAILGSNAPSGHWSTYDTPMEGVRKANYHHIVFQSRPGSPDLNCCSVNAPRGVAQLADWMLTENKGVVYVNFYEDMTAELGGGVTFSVEGNYPACDRVKIAIDTNSKHTFALRIPAWSKNTELRTCDGLCHPTAGGYHEITVSGKAELELKFDFTPYTSEGGGDFAEKSSVYVGPILYGFENAENPSVDMENAEISLAELAEVKPEIRPDRSIVLRLASGVVLKDFYHLGSDGAFYTTWIRTKE